MVFVRGLRRFKEKILQLVRWKPETRCMVKEGSCKEA